MKSYCGLSGIEKKKTFSVAVSSLLGRKHDARSSLREEDALSAAVEVGSVASNKISLVFNSHK